MIAFAGSVPENYHRDLGAVLFQPYAEDLAGRIGEAARVLEIACGTGIVTKTILDRLPRAAIVATDLNQGMIDIAKQHVDSNRVTWRQADAMQLPFADAEFDAVVCQFGFMFVPDKLAAFREVRRVLRRDGLFMFNVWDSLAENDASRTLDEAVSAMFAADPPQFMQMPFSMNDRREIERLLRDARFEHVRLLDVSFMMESPTARQFATGMVRGTPLFDAIQQRGGDLEAVTSTVEKQLRHKYGDAPLRARMRAIVVEAR